MLLLVYCAKNQKHEIVYDKPEPGMPAVKGDTTIMTEETEKIETRETATFAAGCFWGVEHILKGIPGVLETTVGYCGGNFDDPGYYDVSTGTTGHAEAVEVVFDPSKVSYSELLDYFWRLHDPTQVNRQGPDVGTQYRSVIFYHSEAQKQAAEKSKLMFDASGVFSKKAATQIVPATTFYAAEDYHQDYIDKNPSRVCHPLRPK